MIKYGSIYLKYNQMERFMSYNELSLPENDVPHSKIRNELLTATISLETNAVSKVLAKGVDINMDMDLERNGIITALFATYGENGYRMYGEVVCHNKAKKDKLFKMVDFLIDHGADVNKKSNDGRSALFYEACAGNVEGVKFLHKKGAVSYPLMMRFVDDSYTRAVKERKVIKAKNYQDVLNILRGNDDKKEKLKKDILRRIAEHRIDEGKNLETKAGKPVVLEKMNKFQKTVAMIKAKIGHFK